MKKSKGVQLGAMLVAMLLLSMAFVPMVSAVSAQSANGEKITKDKSLKIAMLGDSEGIKEPLAKSVGSNNIYTLQDINSDNIEQANIVFINSSYLENIVGANDKELASSKLDALAHSGKPMIAIGSNPEMLYEFVKPETIVPDLNLGDHKVVALGVLIFPDNTSVTKLVFGEPSEVASEPSEVASEIFNWASEKLAKGKPAQDEVSAQAASWAWKSDIEWSSYYAGTDNYNPYGRFNGLMSNYQLTEDGSNTYNWYSHKIQPQSIPGTYLWSSNWRNDYISTELDADWYQDNDVVDYDPGETSGTNTASVSIGVTSGVNGATVTSSQSWSYSIPDVVVHDHSDFSTDVASWDHDITNVNSGSATNTFIAKPGATIKTLQSNQYYKVVTSHSVGYRYPSWPFDSTWNNGWWNIAIQIANS